MRSMALVVRQVAVGVLLGLGLLALFGVPHALRAEDDALVFETTGHKVDNQNGFLSFWREHNGAQMLGAAVTEPLTENGRLVQYFERGRMELHTELEGSPILLGRIGAEYASALWRTFDPPQPHTAAADEEVFAATGYSLRPPFKIFWDATDGVTMLGLPISGPLWEHVGSEMVLVQYFERGRLEYRAQAAGTSGELVVSTLGRELAVLHSLDVAAPVVPTPIPEPPAAPAVVVPVVEAPVVAAPAVPVVEVAPAKQAPVKAAPAKTAPAARRAEPPITTARGGKYIVVDLSKQWMYAYEGDTQVYDAPVSTGRDGFNTPTGNFSIYAKLPMQTMSGTIRGEYYNVPNIPNVMYINGGVALHGTYWHHQFGIRRMSHGCVNLPLGAAAWVYKWAPTGTSVQVRW